MYFEIEDYRPDITPVGSAISWREGVLLSVIAHLVFIIILLLFPKLFSSDANARARALLARQQQEKQEARRFVFVAPRIDQPAPKPPPRAEPSDQDRIARAPERAPKPANPLPYSRGNSPERVEAPPPPAQAKGQGPEPEPAQGQNALNQPDTKLPESPSSVVQVPVPKPVPQVGANGRVGGGGSLGEALRNLQRYIPREQFNNPGGGGGAEFGPLQFDTKGVEFGPWVRRFIAQVKRNWESIMPFAAMTNRGHVVVTFYVHKDGTLTDVNVIGPCPIEPFNNAAFGALSASNPTVPLPPEYPADKAFFTVTFFYNETPP
jgi:TonB family protein